MKSTSDRPEIIQSHRRGKIARLPRSIRDQLNNRLDDGLEAAQILPWLNTLPEVQEVLTRLFDGTPITPQNLSAWRRGGFEEWLLHRQFIDSALHMQEHIKQLEGVLSARNSDFTQHKLADYMVTHLAVRFAAFLASWDGAPGQEPSTLIKIGQFILRLQQAAYRAETLALKRPRMARRAGLDQLDNEELTQPFVRPNQNGPFITADDDENFPSEENADIPVRRKTPVRRSRPKAEPQSQSINVDKGSPSTHNPQPESTEPTVPESIEPKKDDQHQTAASQPTPPAHSPAEVETRTQNS